MDDKFGKVLIVDDDTHINELIDMYLKSSGYETRQCFNGIDACNIVNEQNIGLVILDIMLPGKDGMEVLKYIRKTSNIPVIMLTAKGEVFDKVLALELGADDYIVKPFDPKELMARVKAVSRRYTTPTTNDDLLKFNGLTIDIGAYEVVYKGNNVKLAPKELELLHFMASNPNKVFTREQLMYEVWGYDYPGDSRTVDVHIKRLREKIKGGEGWEVQTVWGVGYKFEVK
ncbi:response regulator transcription factor [Clostridium sp. NSJ-49]|jgi:two-component system response regulator ResD|uniref:Stage 0 sporulation protein A homolog n=1 Tax=Clostridium disporicum TaxID=84024 RepID=A0A174EBS3_9CLOT|nr:MULTISPECIES: response regulator transcription factor [Clostridium]MBC5624202.1 response regulator transcription factor [Clostridium sp. NSJ-49]MCD2502556.1 response regulator transcription factor [Clostridium sp. NSJ-145]CUO35234.1 winged helix family two component transcriptional regulator [Clostridium disporicum]